MSVREKVQSHDERNGENTKMPLRVICKLVSTGLYCACPPADIVPLIKLQLDFQYAFERSSQKEVGILFSFLVFLKTEYIYCEKGVVSDWA